MVVNGDREADLYWRAGSFEDWASDRASNAARVETGAVLGHVAQIMASIDTYTALWQQGDRIIEFRSEANNMESFVELVDQLRRVGVTGSRPCPTA